MKKYITIIAIICFAGNLIAQDAPKQAPAGGKNVVKKKKKHSHDERDDRRDAHKKK
ncbi:MAG: hypothetical protein ACLQQ4_17760 [Bacteroidia bacterium]